MIRQTPAPSGIAPAEARYFQLMALAPLDDEPAPSRARAPASASLLDPLIGARRFQLMAIGTLDAEPEDIPLDAAA